MGYTLKVDGPTTIELGTSTITQVKFITEIPSDSNARSTYIASTVEIKGTITSSGDDNTPNATKQLGLWSVVPMEKSDCYRSVTIEVIAASHVVRTYSFPNAFVVVYREGYDGTQGVGSFTLIIKQRRDKISEVTVEGGYSI